MTIKIAFLNSAGSLSTSKLARFKSAALSLGYEVLDFDNNSDEAEIARAEPAAILIGSDAMGPKAYRIECLIRGSKIENSIIAAMSSKQTSYRLLRFYRLSTMPTLPVEIATGVRDSTMSGPIIIKPDNSSGMFAPHKFAYRRFDNVKVASQAVWRECQNYPIQYPYFMMPFVDQTNPEDNGKVFGVQAIVRRDGSIYFLPPTETRFDIGSRLHMYGVVGPHEYPDSIREAFQNLADHGFYSNVIFMQFIKHNGKFHVIDLNVRMGQGMENALGASDPFFYKKTLLFLAGASDSVDLSLAGRYALYGVVPSNHLRSVHDVEFDGGKEPDVVWRKRRDIPAVQNSGDSPAAHPIFTADTETMEEAISLYYSVTNSAKIVYNETVS